MHKRSARSLHLNGSIKSGGTSLFGGGGSLVLPTANNAGTIFKVRSFDLPSVMFVLLRRSGRPFVLGRSARFGRLGIPEFWNQRVRHAWRQCFFLVSCWLFTVALYRIGPRFDRCTACCPELRPSVGASRRGTGGGYGGQANQLCHVAWRAVVYRGCPVDGPLAGVLHQQEEDGAAGPHR